MRDKDMYLPISVLLSGILFIALALVIFPLNLTNIVLCFIVCSASLLIGIAGVLCWKNQWIEVVNSNAFVYSTMFGKEKLYYFTEIKDLKYKHDCLELVFENSKVKIDYNAVVSKRLSDAISRAEENL
ncbi:MAG: hypothetical protein ACI4II_00190 [Acutalibacteraceae bacterium]